MKFFLVSLFLSFFLFSCSFSKPHSLPNSATSKAESPATPIAESSATPKAESPAIPKEESSAIPKEESPATPIAESPATPKAESPATPISESSAIPKEESPAESVLQAEYIQESVWRMHNFIHTGTAFSIGPNLFVTNFHVLHGLLKKDNLKSIILDQKASFSFLKVKRIVAVSAPYDLAFFETEQNVTSYLSIAENLPQPNEELSILGYPMGWLKEMKNTGKLIDNGYHYDVSINHSYLSGSSGSPVLDKEGQVVGVVFRATDNSSAVIKSKHLKGLIAGKIGLNCSDFINLTMCLKKEIENLKQIAGEGNAPAQYELAYIYRKGKVIEKDLELAFIWYKKSANQGYTPAQNGLAEMYYDGEGVEKDLELAFSWMKKSAEQGDTPAQYRLANMYYYGEGTEKDLELAFAWAKKSAEQGYAPAQNGLAEMYYNGEGVEKDLELAFSWYKKSAEQGYALARYELAKIIKREKEQRRTLN